MRREAFETATRRPSASPIGARYRPQIVVSVLVVIMLIGGAFYAARLSERAPQVVYSASLEEVEDEAQEGSLKVNINTADLDELDELPEVGPATAETIIDYRRNNGMFRSVDELVSMRNCKTREVEFRALLSRYAREIELAPR